MTVKREEKRPAKAGNAGNKQEDKEEDKQARGGERRALRPALVEGKPFDMEREERLRGLKK